MPKLYGLHEELPADIAEDGDEEIPAEFVEEPEEDE